MGFGGVEVKIPERYPRVLPAERFPKETGIGKTEIEGP
jgi:hypothetical protein